MNSQSESNASIIPERIVLFGSEGGFSRPILQGLLAAGAPVATVVMPGFAPRDASSDTFPVRVQQPQNPASLIGLAMACNVPIMRVRHMYERHLACRINRLAPDILLVACFPFRIPATLRRLARMACWNLHPAILPRYRGPAPVYWQLRNRERQGGVTLHEVSDRLDAGNVVAQKSFPLPEATGSGDLEQTIAETGVELLLVTLELWRAGYQTTYPQDEVFASYYPPAPARDTNFLLGKRGSGATTG